MTQKLTDHICKLAEPPQRGNRQVRCGVTTGFALRITAAGSRSFVFNYRNSRGRERRMTIGPYPHWSLQLARKKAQELRRAVDGGRDPLSEKEELARAPTVSDLGAWYLAGPVNRLALATQVDVRSVWSRMVSPLLGPETRLIDIQRTDVQRMIDVATERFGPYVANRAHSYIRRALNLVVAEGWVERNVATMGIVRNRETPRERFLSPGELGRLLTALERRESAAAHCLRFIALTGCRRGEAQRAEWSQFRFDQRVWTKPASATKSRRTHRVPLSDKALDVLRSLRARRDGSRFVFPGTADGTHISNLKRTWRNACREAGLSDLRIHDLRHTFASIVALSGGSLQTAGALLGHSQIATTARYSHLFDNTLQDAAQQVADSVSLDIHKQINGTH